MNREPGRTLSARRRIDLRRSRHCQGVHHEASFLDRASGPGRSVEFGWCEDDERESVVASVQRAELLGTRRRQTSSHLWPRPERPLEDCRGAWALVTHRLGRTHLPDGIRSSEQPARDAGDRSAHRQGPVAADCCAGTDRKGPRNQQPRRRHACDRRRAGLCLLRVVRAGGVRPGRQSEVGTTAPRAGEPVWRGRLAHRRRRFAGGQPSRQGRLSAGRQSPRRQDSVEDRPLVVSVWVVHSCALASRWD